MKLLDKAKRLISDEEVKEATKDFLGDSISALLGDSAAVGRIMLAVCKSPFFFREKIFWDKFELFLTGIDVTDRDRANFCAKLAEDGEKNENPYRLIQVIDRAETKRKIRFLVNASRCLGADFITHTTYFRICHAITSVLEEDLIFVSEHIKDSEDFGYCDTIQGLLNAGLVYQSVLDANGNSRYSFTPFADTLDQFALSYENVERYPMICSLGETSARPMGTQIEQLKIIEF